jgi:hypothetical protein
MTRLQQLRSDFPRPSIPESLTVAGTLVLVLTATGFVPRWLDPALAFIAAWIAWCLGLTLIWLDWRLERFERRTER